MLRTQGGASVRAHTSTFREYSLACYGCAKYIRAMLVTLGYLNLCVTHKLYGFSPSGRFGPAIYSSISFTIHSLSVGVLEEKHTLDGFSTSLSSRSWYRVSAEWSRSCTFLLSLFDSTTCTASFNSSSQVIMACTDVSTSLNVANKLKNFCCWPATLHLHVSKVVRSLNFA